MKDTRNVEPAKKKTSIARKTLKDLNPEVSRQREVRGAVSSKLGRSQGLSSSHTASFSRG
jgi:hypothetical protein